MSPLEQATHAERVAFLALARTVAAHLERMAQFDFPWAPTTAPLAQALAAADTATQAVIAEHQALLDIAWREAPPWYDSPPEPTFEEGAA